MLKLYPQTFSGRLELTYTKSITKFSTPEKQYLIRPDFFDEECNWYRLLRIDEALTLIKITKSGTIFWNSSTILEVNVLKKIIKQLIVPIELPDCATIHLPGQLANRFKNLAPLVHVSSASLEEALIKAIIRQVIKAEHAKKLIHRFITSFGESYNYDGVICYTFPTIEKILELSLDDLVSCGLGFKAALIKNVAKKIEKDNLKQKINVVSTETALEILQEIKGIGHWTAHVTLCDLKGDWSLYPFDDLAVRTWASNLWSGYNWPQNPQVFRQEWERLNGSYVGQITFFLLALATMPSERSNNYDSWP